MNRGMGPVLVVVSHYNARPPHDVGRLLQSMRSMRAGWPFSVRVVVNNALARPLHLPPELQPVEVFYRENVGHNIGAWDHGWRIPEFRGRNTKLLTERVRMPTPRAPALAARSRPDYACAGAHVGVVMIEPSRGGSPGVLGRLLAALWRYGRWPAVLYLGVCLLMMLFEESLVYVPTRYPRGDWSAQGLAVEDAWFEAADGARLHGWFLAHPNPRAVALYCHGNGGNVTHRADVLRVLHDRLRLSTLVLDYRGYGRSEGSPDEAGILADARAARAWLAARTGLPEREIVLWGHSLGGAVAVDLAAADGAKALVLECTFSSAPDVAAHHYPWLPVRPLMRTRLDSAAKIGRYRGPLLQAHGDADTVVPIRFGRKLFEAANKPKQFEVVPGARHDDVFAPEYYEKVERFLDGAPPASPDG